MSKTVNITSNPILKIEGIDLSFGETFNRVLNNFVETPTKVFNLLETVILSCVMVEAIVKEQLKKINPTLVLQKIEPEAVALVSGKGKSLLAKPNNEVSDVRTASITELMERLAKFKDLSLYHTGLRDFFNLRNKIVHSAEKVSLEEHEISILLTKYIFPFIKEYVDVSPGVWQDVQKIAGVAQNKFNIYLVKKILQCRNAAKKLKPEEIAKLFSFNLVLDKTESIHKDYLVCPACHQESMALVEGIDVDVSDGETTAYGYKFADCRICNLHLDDYEIEEIISNAQTYFSPSPEQVEEWEEALLQPDYSNVL